ncbi:hypothetical protein [Corticimicrobacter populi]|uniref:Uncharacterized protein n=1 Tax=Corticimicrobacter populi TaxID=2175229 RepID=A0A2V1JU31_9BURK|nr:hypothetical protein [Corticimicrobacter populi]PWF21499.1 hypothetical protein DD235_14660 [Corticimicrobacter populi]QDQ88907.1 hypothetical protein FMZ60_15825 [Alcaligenaceae bacterium SJ-26]
MSYKFLLYTCLAMSPLLLIGFFLKISRAREAGRQSDPAAGMRRISKKSWLLKFFDVSGYQAECYFDVRYFFIRDNGALKEIPLTSIRRVYRTSVKVSGRYMWAVVYAEGAQEHTVKFIHNFTVFNKDFLGFLSAVEKANPAAGVEKLTVFSL